MSSRHRKSPTRARPRSDRDVEQAYQQLIRALQQADQVAVSEVRAGRQNYEQALDLREAGSVLDRYPRLVSYLNGIKDRENARKVGLAQPDLTLSNAPTHSTPQASPIASGWSGSKDIPRGVENARMLRQLAETDPWVRAAINLRRQQIGRADIAVMPTDSLKPYSRGLMKRIQHLLDQPNELRDSYRSLIEPVIEDILVLDRGVLTKNMTAKREPTDLYYEDGATIKIYAGWSGNPAEYRYLYEPPANTAKPVPLRNDECIVFIATPASHRFGLSPVQVLYDTIQADLAAGKSAKNLVDMKPPPHVMQIEGATPSQILNLRTMYEAELAGRKEMFFVGGSGKLNVHPLVASARDNQWLEWQIYLLRKIAAVFQVSPQQLGVTFDINKATGDTQQQIFEDTGLIPLLLLLEEQLNRELLADFAPKNKYDRSDISSLNLRIVYPEVSETARQIHAERAIDLAVKGLAGLPSMTVNEVLEMRGAQPVAGGNTFYLPSDRLGAVPFLSRDGGNTGDYVPITYADILGAQEAAGGPSEGAKKEPEPTAGKGEVDQETAADKPTATGGGSYNHRRQNSSVSPPPVTYREDTRGPGKRWTPLHLRHPRRD